MSSNLSGRQPKGNSTGAPMVQNNPMLVGSISVNPNLKAVAIVFDFAKKDGDIVPGTDSYDPIPVKYFKSLLFGTKYDPYEMKAFSQYAVYTNPQTRVQIHAPTDRTLPNYLKETSNGWIASFTGDVVRVTLPHPYSYYAIGKAYGVLSLPNANGDYSMAEIISDAAVEADKIVDFNQYAAKGTALENVFFIHAGTGAEWSGASDIIWSHSWEYASAFCYWMYAQTGNISWIEEDSYYKPDLGIKVDDVLINNYSIEPEVGGDLTGFSGVKSGPFPPDVGVYAHEFAHVMGLPDQYDYGYESEGTGIYSLMSGGSWTRWPNAVQYSGNTPVHLDAWSKTYLGFDKLTKTISTPKSSQAFTLQPASKGGGMVKIIVPNSGGSEYFLIENRQQVDGTFDMGLNRSSMTYGVDGSKIHGLAIYHVDENVLARNFSRPEEAPAISQKTAWNMSTDKATGEWHYGISILQANGRWDLERGTLYYGENHLYKTGDPFGPNTYPASSSYYTNFFDSSRGQAPNYSGVFVKNIVESSLGGKTGGSITFTAGIE